MTTKFTYEEAYAELQQIVSDIESGDVNVDQLSEKIARATALIDTCKAKLSATEAEVEELLKKLQPEEEEDLDVEESSADEE